TGPSKNNSLVAVSSGLLRRMNKDQVEGVLGHEVAHIANGDMVTMTLIQGIINAIVLFFARILANVISSQADGRARTVISLVSVFGLQFALRMLCAAVVNYYSGLREYRADKGGARHAGRKKMSSALQALRGTEHMVDREHEALANLKISGSSKR